MLLRFCIYFFSLFMFSFPVLAEPTCPDFLQLDMRQLHSSKTVNLCSLAVNKKAILLVNTASHCGFTKQFTGLEALHKKYKDQGLLILGFPSDSFNQESKEEKETARVCFKNFGVTFNMFETLAVTGLQTHSVFKYLTEKTEAPSWNFNKYLWVDGKITHFGSRVKPLDSELEQAIQTALTHPIQNPVETKLSTPPTPLESY